MRLLLLLLLGLCVGANAIATEYELKSAYRSVSGTVVNTSCHVVPDTTAADELVCANSCSQNAACKAFMQNVTTCSLLVNISTPGCEAVAIVRPYGAARQIMPSLWTKRTKQSLSTTAQVALNNSHSSIQTNNVEIAIQNYEDKPDLWIENITQNQVNKDQLDVVYNVDIQGSFSNETVVQNVVRNFYINYVPINMNATIDSANILRLSTEKTLRDSVRNIFIQLLFGFIVVFFPVLAGNVIFIFRFQIWDFLNRFKLV